jgi:hypothetical protein
MIPTVLPKLRFTPRRLSRESAVALRAVGRKYCPACKAVKPVTDFHSDRARSDGRAGVCADCRVIRDAEYYAASPEKGRARHAKYYAANPEKELARRAKYREENPEKARDYRVSIAGVAAGLRADHQLDKPTSIKWATILCDDDTRCEICGIPCRILIKQDFWMIGGERMNRRLTLDHLRPGNNNGGLRALCCSCNQLRGHAQFTDGEVLTRIREWYRETRGLRFLWWLNSRVVDGVCTGGRAHRNEFMEKKVLRLKPEEGSNAGSQSRRTG